MRISLTYLYTITRYGYPPRVDDDIKAFAEIRQLGFRWIETEALGESNLAALNANREEVRRALDANGLHVHNFCIVDPALVSMDARVREAAYERFRTGAELGAYFGAETLHLASYAPPVEYADERPYQLGTEQGYRFANLPRMRIPGGFDWNEVWRVVVESCRRCADIAAGVGRTVIMEPRVGEIVASVDSMLRLIEGVARPNFKANLDTAHFCAQRENAALSVYKLQGNFANVHIADNDPATTDHLPVGDGIIDWREFFRALQAVGYDGYLGLDLGPGTDLIAGCRRSIERIREVASELGLPVEV